MNIPGVYILSFLVSLFLCLLAVPPVKRIAITFGVVDRPGARRINKKVIPRMGGIAMVFGVCGAFFVHYLGYTFFGWPNLLLDSFRLHIKWPVVSTAFFIIFAVGILDDVFTLKPYQKFIGQIISATVAVTGGLVIGDISNPFVVGAYIDLGFISYPLTILYLVCYMNIINLIDGLDGLAAGICGLAAVTDFIFALNAQKTDAAFFAIVLAGVCLGFLKYNFHPASVFMGDSGSLTLGFLLGAISLLSVTRVASLTTILLALMVVAVPILDTFSALIRRARAHVNIGHADRGHIHHRLISEGFDHKQTVLLMYAWTVMLCVGALFMDQLYLWPRVAVFLVMMFVSFAFARHLHLFEPVLYHHFNPKTGNDEIVGPDDAAFKEEAERFHEKGPLDM